MTVRVTQGMTTASVLASLESISDKLSKTQTELASGKRLTQPSDDPYGVAQALQYRGDVAQTQQFQRNVADAQSWQTVSDTALAQVSSLVLRARDLVVQASNDTTDAAGRASIAAEISQLLDAIKQEGNTQYAGRYVFSGTATQTPPYNLADPTDAYAGNSGTIDHEIGPGVNLQVNSVGSAVLGGDTGSGNTGLLKTLRDVLAHLAAGDTTSLRNTDLKNLSDANDTIVNAQAVVGARANRLEIAANRLADLEQLDTKNLSDTEDADMAKTLTDLSTQQAVYQAALRAGAALIKPSLMDFLSTG